MKSDLRNTPAPETPKPSPGKKDTRRWCKGKVGVEHDWSAPMLYAEARSVTPQEAAMNDRERSYRIYVRKCRECGREEWVR